MNKKWIAVIAAIAVLLVCVFILFNRSEKTVPEETAPTETAEPIDGAEDQDAAEETPANPALDFDALYALYNPDEPVMVTAGKTITWGEYSYWLNYITNMINSSYQYYYGTNIDWNEVQDGERINDTVMNYVQAYAIQLIAIENAAEKNDITISEEQLAEIEETTKSMLERAGETDLDAYLAGLHLTRDVYDRINRNAVLYQNLSALYGENGSEIDDADAIAWLEDNGYVRAVHTLLMTVDPQTREALSDEVKAERYAKAEEILAELQSIPGVEQRYETFIYLMEENSEDTGTAMYPTGYTFNEGTMVKEFEDAVNALENYEISGIVETSYGYHIIMRLPLEADGVISYDNSTLAPITAKSNLAIEKINEILTAEAEVCSASCEFLKPITEINLSDYLMK